MELTDSQIKDLMLGTLNELGRGRFTQIAQELQEYEVMSNLLKKEKVIFDSGKGIQRTIMTKVGGTFRHVGLHSQDEVNIADLLDKISITWKHGTAYWAWERREMLENRGKALIVNIIKPRRAAAMIDIAQGMEEAFFDAPFLMRLIHLINLSPLALNTGLLKIPLSVLTVVIRLALVIAPGLTRTKCQLGKITPGNTLIFQSSIWLRSCEKPTVKPTGNRR